MFRASPWISYDPANNNRNDEEPEATGGFQYSYHMNEDVDMDAPQISTLREEDSPPPAIPNIRTGKFRVKLLVNENRGAGSSSPSKQTGGESEDEDEDEEDQLIDDDDDDVVKPGKLAPSIPLARSNSKRKPAAPKRSRKDKPAVEKRRPKDQEDYLTEKYAGALNDATIMAWIEAPSSGKDPSLQMQMAPEWDIASVGSNAPPIAPGRKKGGPRKAASARQRIQKSGVKATKSAPIPHIDDGENLSEVYTGTAASSPAPHDDDELENIGPFRAPSLSDFNLENIPLPVYPLPTKPFPVQPPVKIGTGFAPIMPLDKGHKHVRHWRMANREIRGIAGGRWFVRSWVGEKESELAAATAEKPGAIQNPADREHDKNGGLSVALPKLPSMAIQGHLSGKGSSAKSKGKMDLGSTAASSRSASAVPDMHVPRAPSKMRTAVAAFDETPSEPLDVNIDVAQQS